MKTKITLAALIACIGMLSTSTSLHAEESNSADSSYYEEGMQGNEDSMAAYGDMPADMENYDPADEGSLSNEDDLLEEPAE